MNIILTSGILLIIASLVFQKNKKVSPYWGFIFVFIIMGFQEGVEGDFMGYKESYETMAKGMDVDLSTEAEDTVWLFLNETFSKVFPFWLFIILLAAFECSVLFNLGNKYGSRKYGWVGPVMFFFTFYMMLIQMKALRQGFAVGITVLAYLMAGRRKGFWWSMVLMIAAFFVHHSTLVAMPFILWHLIVSHDKDYNKMPIATKHKEGFLFPFVMTAAFLFVYTLKTTVFSAWMSQLSLLGQMNDIALAGYLESEQKYAFDISWLIVLYDAVMVFLCSWFMKQVSHRQRLLAIASIVACYGDMLLFGMGSLPRICMFYNVYSIVTYPLITEKIEARFGKVAAVVFIVFLIGYAVKTSLPMIISSEGDSFGTYRFVFM